MDAKTIARRYFEDLWNNGDTAVIPQLVAPNATGHVNGQTIVTSALAARVRNTYDAYPDLKFSVDDLLADGNKAVVRWTMTGTHRGTLAGVPGSGARVSVTGINIFRVTDGRIAEMWVSADDLGELRQIGALALQ